MRTYPERLEAFLSEANVAVLATVDAKGRAHAAPNLRRYLAGQPLMNLADPARGY